MIYSTPAKLKTTLSLFLLSITMATGYGQVYSRHGMVVSSEKTASAKGAEILKKGGNAIDAAVATAFCLAVTEPGAGNIGGGGFIVYMGHDGVSTTFDFREKAPLAAHANMFLDSAGHLIKDINHLNILAVGVPGTVAGLYKAHKKLGKLPWKEVVQPAIDLARNGFEFNWSLYRTAQRIDTTWQAHPDMLQYFKNDDGYIPEPGQLWFQPELANTLTTIRDHGHNGFYKGKVAKMFEEVMRRKGGLITTKDLKRYEAIERKPIIGSYREHTIVGMPPPSSGGVTLMEMLNMLENFSLDTIEFNSATYFHLLTEIMRRGYADRAEHLGDPDFNPDMPVDKLLSKAHAQNLSSSITPNLASPSDSSRFAQLYDGTNTTHLSVMDQEGNAVALTFTLEYYYGSRIVADELGFIFNNEMGDFNPMPGVTDTKGHIGTQANLIAPEKRMLSSMTPTIIACNNKPVMVIGSPGGRTIINTVFQTIVAVLDYQMRIDQAIEATKIHHAWLPDKIRYEQTKLSPDTRMLMQQWGHTLEAIESLGDLMGITYDRTTNTFTGGCDSASPDGAAVGY